ncbi:MAG: DNA-3-methyladenine glycosylase 2 family protein [Abitibacteriaceae bacterium]|nr:DNA-3-methyladenine glycosylase 2 family protein [Abditibacteriaceae bacterium]
MKTNTKAANDAHAAPSGKGQRRAPPTDPASIKRLHTRAVNHLKKSDPLLAAVIKRVGPCEMRSEPDAWRALSSSIIGQQISTYAARAIRGRFAALAADHDFPPPDYVLKLSDESLRGIGLSANKTRSIRDLAEHFVSGAIDSQKFQKMDEEEIIAALIPVRGIGRWTAEMFLIFSLGRLDILAVDDLGLRNAMRKIYDLSEPPSPTVMRSIAEPWQPYRSVASWYLWRSLDNEPKVS